MKPSNLASKKGVITLQYIPYLDIAKLGPEAKIKKILKSVKENKIILVEGRLDPFEESKLIEMTMGEINRKFSGIEIASIIPNNKKKLLIDKIKNEFIRVLFGKREGVTIVGPASIVKEIKKNPNKIELFTKI